MLHRRPRSTILRPGTPPSSHELSCGHAPGETHEPGPTRVAHQPTKPATDNVLARTHQASTGTPRWIRQRTLGLRVMQLNASDSSRTTHARATPNTDDAPRPKSEVHAEDNDQGLVATNALTMRQWPFPQVAARRNDDDPIEEWGRDSERATPRDDPPMPKAARRCKAWVGTEAPLGTPIQGRSAQAASSPTNTKRTQAPAETRAVETGPGREMLSTVEEPG